MTAEEQDKILRNDGLVWRMVKKYSYTPHDPEDLAQVGRIGLIKAVRFFDAGKGVSFSTYACTVIDNEIKSFLSRNSRHYGIDSLDRPVGYDNHGNEIPLYARIPTRLTLEEAVVEKYNMEMLLDQLQKLSVLERDVLLLLYPMDGSEPATQEKAAVSLGISKQKVSDIKINSLLKLRRRLSGWET